MTRSRLGRPLAGHRGRFGRLTVLSCAIGAMATPAWAGSTLKLGDDVSMDYAVTVNYGIGMRVEKQSKDLLSNINADDSDRNFKKDSLVTNRVSVLAEADVKRGDFGFFLRGSSFYDDVYHQHNDNDSPATINKSGPNDEFSSKTRYWDGGRTTLLDAYAYGGWRLGDQQKLTLKLGKHLVAWGENIFFPGISGAQSQADATKANIPGVETKDILLPVGQASGQLTLSNDLSVMAYAQYKFEPTQLQPHGDYLFTTDVIGPGAERLFLAPGFAINRTGDVKARDGGQWGVGARYRVTPSTEIGAYHVNYHSKIPALEFDTSNLTYHVRYFEDIQASALSFSSRVGDHSVGGELGYYDQLPVQVNTGAFPVQVRGKAMQAQMNIFSSFSDTPAFDQAFFLAEVIGQRLLSVDGNEFGAGADNSSLTSVTRSAWGYQLAFIPLYKNVFNGWDLSVPIAWNHGVKGIAPIQHSGILSEGDKRFNIGATFTYLGNLEVALKYNAFLGKSDVDKFGREMRPLFDRDFVTLNVKYSF